MKARTDHLLDELLSLSPEERAEVTVALLDSLETEESEVVSQAWLDEIRQRKADIMAGRATLAPWDKTRGRILAL